MATFHAIDDFALRVSALNGQLDTVKYLIEHGANIHAENDGALRLSAWKGHLEVVKYLIEHGLIFMQKMMPHYNKVLVEVI